MTASTSRSRPCGSIIRKSSARPSSSSSTIIRTAFAHNRSRPWKRRAELPVRPRTVAHRDVVKSRRLRGSDGRFRALHRFLRLPGPGEPIRRLLNYFAENPDSKDLLHGPLLYDDPLRISTHFRPQWSGGMSGLGQQPPRRRSGFVRHSRSPCRAWAIRTCRRVSWPDFNPAFRGFGGEEWYIHEKFRRNGGHVLCLPFLRWLHRFNRPQGCRIETHSKDRI